MPEINNHEPNSQPSSLTRPLRKFFKSKFTLFSPGKPFWLFLEMIRLFIKNPLATFKLLNLKNVKLLRNAMNEHDAVRVLYFTKNYVSGSNNDSETRLPPAPLYSVPPITLSILNDYDQANIGFIRKQNLFNESFYCEHYPDIEENRVDPLEHYYIQGWREARDPSPDFDTDYYISNYLGSLKQVTICPLVHYISEGVNKGYLTIEKVFTADELLSQAIAKKKYPEIVCAISHDNYAGNLGGVQVHMQEEQQAFGNSRISYLHFYPKGHQKASSASLEFLINVNLDGIPLGSIRNDQFIKLGKILQNNDSLKIKGILIHHLLHWSMMVIEKFLDSLNPPSIIMWLHDYYTCCPQHTLLRNNYEYCFKPGLNSNACMICKFGALRKVNHGLFREFLSKYNPLFLTPSEVSKSIFIDDFPEFDSRVVVTPLLKISEIKKIPQKRISQLTDQHYRIKIAYLGLANPHKGWNAWQRLIKSVDVSDFEFFLLSNRNLSTREKFIPVSTTRQNRDAAINAMQNNHIDIVLLWSLWPETYSLVLFEALASGCFIITNPLSGNIASYVKDNNCGIVFDDEKTLLDFFSKPDIVKEKLLDYYAKRATTFSITPDITTVAKISLESENRKKVPTASKY